VVVPHQRRGERFFSKQKKKGEKGGKAFAIPTNQTISMQTEKKKKQKQTLPGEGKAARVDENRWRRRHRREKKGGNGHRSLCPFFRGGKGKGGGLDPIGGAKEGRGQENSLRGGPPMELRRGREWGCTFDQGRNLHEEENGAAVGYAAWADEGRKGKHRDLPRRITTTRKKGGENPYHAWRTKGRGRERRCFIFLTDAKSRFPPRTRKKRKGACAFLWKKNKKGDSIEIDYTKGQGISDRRGGEKEGELISVDNPPCWKDRKGGKRATSIDMKKRGGKGKGTTLEDQGAAHLELGQPNGATTVF